MTRKEYLTIDNVWEELKLSGEREKRILSESEMVSEMIRKIINLRIEKRMTQKQLAELCGMNQSGIARIENMQVMPKIDTVARIAYQLNCDFKLSETFDTPKILVIYKTETPFLNVSNRVNELLISSRSFPSYAMTPATEGMYIHD